MNIAEHGFYSPLNDETYIADLQQYIIAEYLSTDGELNWGRLICTWNEKKENGTIRTHMYAPVVDGITGEVYVDDRPGLIFVRIFAHLFARPIFTIAKTIYHLTFYSTFKEIGNALWDKNGSNEDKIKNIFKTIADIAVTPLMGIVLTIASAAILIIAPFNNEFLYDGRKFLGKIEYLSNWGQYRTKLTFARCFQPHPIETFKMYGYRGFGDTVYDDGSGVDHALSNYARSRIHYKTTHCDFFLCGSHDAKEVYYSYLPT